MRIGLYGGTFDPVHLGHVHAALTVQDALQLDGGRLLRRRLELALQAPQQNGGFYLTAQQLRDTADVKVAMQVQLEINRFCANTQLVYFIRAMPLEATHTARRVHDHLIERAFHRVEARDREAQILEAREAQLRRGVVRAGPPSPSPSPPTPTSLGARGPAAPSVPSARHA